MTEFRADKSTNPDRIIPAGITEIQLPGKIREQVADTRQLPPEHRSLGTDHRSAGILPVTICRQDGGVRALPNLFL